MSYYEAKKTICSKLAEYLDSVMANRALLTRPVVEQYRGMMDSITDMYSRSLLCTGLARPEAPLFANVPSSMIEYDLDKNLEEVFSLMNWPTTQKQVSIVARQLLRQSAESFLTDEQKEQLLQLQFFRALVFKTTNWLVQARAEILGMCDNLPLVQTVTEEEKEFVKLLQFDWYYDYSDDNSVWRFGAQKHKEAITKINAALADKPELMKVVVAVAKANRLTADFFTKVF